MRKTTVKSEKTIRIGGILLALLLAAGLGSAVVFHGVGAPDNPIRYNVAQLMPQKTADAAEWQPQINLSAISATQREPDPEETTTEQETTTAPEETTEKEELTAQDTTTERQETTTLPQREEPATVIEKQEPTTAPGKASAEESTSRETENDKTEQESGGTQAEPVTSPSAKDGENHTVPKEDASESGRSGDDREKDRSGTNDPSGTADENRDGEETVVKPGEEQRSEPGKKEAYLVTDLYSGEIERAQTEDGVLPFYVYYSDATVDADIRVNLNHKNPGDAGFQGNGSFLTSDGVNYRAELKPGVNKLSVYYMDASGKRRTASFLLNFVERRADEESPVVGTEPPVIGTNLDTWEGNIKTAEFTFIVGAFMQNGAAISKSGSYEGIEVCFDGTAIAESTGSPGQYEYVLHFQRPNVGDTETHTVTVRAWDQNGNSRYVSYDVTYEAYDEGEVIGSVTMVIDATTVGLGILDSFEYDIVQGEPAAATILAMLEDFGYEPTYDGSEDVGFYLRNIYRSDTFSGAAIDNALMTYIERDGIRLTEPCGRDSLGEYDFTTGSGWMFAVNGEYPGKGLSDFYLNDGDTIYLRYTLAYGKDIGGYTQTGNGYGSLSSYCGKWTDETYEPLAHDYQVTDTKVATPEENGYTEYTCSRCGDTYREEITAEQPPENESDENGSE